MLMRAVVLLSGGLDSSTCLAMAHAQGRELYALTVIYGQRHDAELSAARRVAQEYPLREHRFATVDLGSFGGSALTDAAIDVPKGAEPDANRIPVTYVPARNTVFLSMALAFAEARGAEEIWIGVNAVDYSGYPDCRPEFLEQFERLAQLATKVGVEGDAQIRVVAPLIQMRKSEIVAKGEGLGVDYSLTVTCYDPDTEGRACGECEACALRREGFLQAGLADPTRYR
jgi:7-cyano-7-deazaguanine synthase